jgi:hypothetical protein
MRKPTLHASDDNATIPQLTCYELKSVHAALQQQNDLSQVYVAEVELSPTCTPAGTNPSRLLQRPDRQHSLTPSNDWLLAEHQLLMMNTVQCAALA